MLGQEEGQEIAGDPRGMVGRVRRQDLLQIIVVQRRAERVGHGARRSAAPLLEEQPHLWRAGGEGEAGEAGAAGEAEAAGVAVKGRVWKWRWLWWRESGQRGGSKRPPRQNDRRGGRPRPPAQRCAMRVTRATCACAFGSHAWAADSGWLATQGEGGTRGERKGRRVCLQPVCMHYLARAEVQLDTALLDEVH